MGEVLISLIVSILVIGIGFGSIFSFIWLVAPGLLVFNWLSSVSFLHPPETIPAIANDKPKILIDFNVFIFLSFSCLFIYFVFAIFSCRFCVSQQILKPFHLKIKKIILIFNSLQNYVSEKI